MAKPCSFNQSEFYSPRIQIFFYLRYISEDEFGFSIPEFLCDREFNQSTTNAGEIVTITINDACWRYIGDNCAFQCPSTYKKKENQGPLLCTSIGWDRQTEELCERRPILFKPLTYNPRFN